MSVHFYYFQPLSLKYTLMVSFIIKRTNFYTYFNILNHYVIPIFYTSLDYTKTRMYYFILHSLTLSTLIKEIYFGFVFKMQ